MRLACLIMFCFSHVLLGAEGEDAFLLPKDKEDPLKLRPFLESYALEDLASLYEQIQVAKASADTEALLSLKESFCALNQPEEYWQGLVSQLKQEVKGDSIDLWPGQSVQQCIGSILFFPQERILIPDDILCAEPGIATSLVISAYFGNPLAMLELSKGYSALVREFRGRMEDGDEEINSASHKMRAESLKFRALKIFQKARDSNKMAQFYVMHNAYREHLITLQDYVAYLNNAYIPKAYHALAELYEWKQLRIDANAQKAFGAQNENEVAYNLYCQALQGGCLESIWGLYRLSDESPEQIDKMWPYYKAAEGLGYYLAADKHKEEGNFAKAKQLYECAGALGYLWAYFELADEILIYNIPSSNPEQEAISYYLKADRLGLAQGSRRIIGQPRLYLSHENRFKYIQNMMDLNDIEGYEAALRLISIYYPCEKERSIKKQEFESRLNTLTAMRERVFNLLKPMA